jgi:glycosyltransferase involved in cell wall biosynthesis
VGRSARRVHRLRRRLDGRHRGALAPFGDRITLIRKENGGPASAYNAAVRAARCDFVVQTDHDDTFLPERLEAIAAVAVARPDIDVIATDAAMELDGKAVGRYNELNPFRVDDQRAAALSYCFFGWPAIRRTALLAVGGFDESLRIAFDWDCWVRLILNGSRVALIDEPLYRFRLVGGSVSSDTAKNLGEDAIVLQRLRSDPRLSRDEQLIVEQSIRDRKQYIELREAKEALLLHRSGARRLALRVCRGSHHSARARVKAGISAVAPGLARRVLRRQIAASPTGGMNLQER